jgi:hypothetical protein
MHGPGSAVSSGRHMRVNAMATAPHGLQSAKIKNKFDNKKYPEGKWSFFL